MGSVSGVGGSGGPIDQPGGSNQQKQEVGNIIDLLEQLKTAEESGNQLKVQSLFQDLQGALRKAGDDPGMPSGVEIEINRALSDMQSGDGTLNVQSYLQEFQQLYKKM